MSVSYRKSPVIILKNNSQKNVYLQENHDTAP